MDLMPSPEQDEIAATARAFLAARLPVTGESHDGVPGDITDALWQECCDLGWLALGLSEEAGGVGFTIAEEIVLFEELGRGLAPGPFLPGVVGAHASAAAGDLALAGAVASGATRVALGTPFGEVAVDGRTVSADLSVVHAAGADLILVATPELAALLPASACGIEPLASVDPTVPVARAEVRAVAASVMVEGSAAYERALILAAALGAGAAAGVLDIAVAYAKDRVQFGKPIGTYQAIKHPCADMAVRVECARAQVAYAAVAWRDGLPDAGGEAVVAKFFADEAARLNAATCVQVHGALGFTVEATPYRYVQRAHVLGRIVAQRPHLLAALVSR